MAKTDKTVKTFSATTGYVLSLDPQEAQVLLNVVERVVEYSTGTNKKHLQDIAKSLSGTGLKATDSGYATQYFDRYFLNSVSQESSVDRAAIPRYRYFQVNGLRYRVDLYGNKENQAEFRADGLWLLSSRFQIKDLLSESYSGDEVENA